MKNITIILGIGFLLALGCFSQRHPRKIPSFPELSLTDTLAVHAKWQWIQKYDRTETRELVQFFAPPPEGYADSSNCFAHAQGHFRLHKQNYYIVDWYDSLFTWGAETRLYVFVPDSNKYRFVQILALSYGSEGSDIETASWFFDADRDRSPELFTRSYSYFVMGDTSLCSDSIMSWSFEKTGLKPLAVADPKQLKKKLHFNNAMLCETE